MIESCREELAKNIKEAKETNNLEGEKYLKGLSRFLSLVENFYKVLEYYEGKEEFEEIIKFFCYISEIFSHYLSKYVKGKKVNLDKIKNISSCLAYGYYLYGGGVNYDGIGFLSLGKCFDEEDEEDYEDLDIPIPIRYTDEWYFRFKNLNCLKYLTLYRD